MVLVYGSKVVGKERGTECVYISAAVRLRVIVKVLVPVAALEEEI